VKTAPPPGALAAVARPSWASITDGAGHGEALEGQGHRDHVDDVGLVVDDQDPQCIGFRFAHPSKCAPNACESAEDGSQAALSGVSAGGTMPALHVRATWISSSTPPTRLPVLTDYVEDAPVLK